MKISLDAAMRARDVSPAGRDDTGPDRVEPRRSLTADVTDSAVITLGEHDYAATRPGTGAVAPAVVAAGAERVLGQALRSDSAPAERPPGERPHTDPAPAERPPGEPLQTNSAPVERPHTDPAPVEPAPASVQANAGDQRRRANGPRRRRRRRLRRDGAI